MVWLRLRVVVVVVFACVAIASALEDDDNAPQNGELPVFVNSEGGARSQLEDSELGLREEQLDLPPTPDELLRSASQREIDEPEELDLDAAIVSAESAALQDAEVQKEHLEVSDEALSMSEVLLQADSQGQISLLQADSQGQESVLDGANTADAGTHKMVQTCEGNCVEKTMHDSVPFQQYIAREHYSTASFPMLLEEAATNATGSGSNSSASGGASKSGACCPCSSAPASGGNSSSSASNKTSSTSSRVLLSATQIHTAAQNSSTPGNGNGTAAGGSGKCCQCSGSKEVTLSLNMEKPPNAAEMTKFQSAFASELSKALKLAPSQVKFGSTSDLSFADETSLEEEQDTELGEAASKFTVTFQVSPAGGQNVTKLIDQIKKDVSNPTSSLSQGTLFSKVDKSAGMGVKSVKAASACDKAASKWSYMDNPSQVGPANWAKNYPKCGLAGVQSPIRLPSVTPKKAKFTNRRLDFDYKAAKLTLMNDGRNLMVMVPSGSTFRVPASGSQKSQTYKLQYAVFHSPSEHVFTDENGNDVRYAAEMQLHHRAEDGRLVVLAVLFAVNAPSTFIEKMFKKVPEKCQSAKLTEELKFEDILPFSRTYYMYYGTLTSPPCTDSVTWYVLRNHATISLAQLEKIRNTLHLDVPKPVAAAAHARGTVLGSHEIRVIDKDKNYDYEFSKALMGDVRPLQPLGKRTLWSTPAKV